MPGKTDIDLESDVRSETITINVTPRIKAAMEQLVEVRKASGEPRWSINREGWQRVKYTFDLTGTDGQTIDTFAKRLREDKGSAKVRLLLIDAVFKNTERAPMFTSKLSDISLSSRGRPRNRGGSSRISALGGPPMRRSIPSSDYVETEDLSLLRSDLREAISALTVDSDAPIDDDMLPDIGTIGSEVGPRFLKRLLNDLQSRIPSVDDFESGSIVQRTRVLRRLHREWSAIREALITHELARYAMRWAQIRDDAIDDILPYFETDAFSEILESQAYAAALRIDEAHDQLRSRLIEDDRDIAACADLLKSIATEADNLFFPDGPHGPDFSGGLFGLGGSSPESG